MKYPAALAVCLALMLCAGPAHAQRIGYYATGMTPAAGSASSTGEENSAVIVNSALASSRSLISFQAVSYGAAALMVMVFDSATLPANGAIPIAECALPIGSTAPTTCGLLLPYLGMPLSKGLTVACSTTGKTLTVDTTSGGDCYFEVGWH